MPAVDTRPRPVGLPGDGEDAERRLVQRGAGARVVAMASASDAGYCRELGASVGLDYADPALPAHLAQACPDGVDVHVDTSATNDLATAVRLLHRGGRIMLLAGVRTAPVLPAGELYMKDGSVRGSVISQRRWAELAEAATTINRQLVAGRLRARTVEVLPLSAAAETHLRMERGELRGRRVVLVPPGHEDR